MAGRSAHVRLITPATNDENNRNALLGEASTDNTAGRGRKMRGGERNSRRSSSHGDQMPLPNPDGVEQAASRRLASFLPSAGHLASSAARASPLPHAFLPARSQSRADSALPSRDNSASLAPPMAASSSQQPKGHTSPSKTSSARTYDAKLVSREMHRLGNLAHLPSLALAPSLSATPSNITLASHMAPPSGTGSAALSASALAAESPWMSLHVLILPLFNEEPLRVPIEDLNTLVKRHIQTVIAAAPGKAVAALEHDTFELVAAGMVTFVARLADVDDGHLLPRLVELWSSFWTRVLPYLEGALLPLQTDPILSSLYRLPKAIRPASPTAHAQNGKGPSGGGGASGLHQTAGGGTQIDVRALALVAFRDRIVLPLFPRLYAQMTTPASKDDPDGSAAHAPSGAEPYQGRLQQMLLILVSQRSQRLVPLSLTAPPPQPPAGEAALARLLRAMYAPALSQRPAAGVGAPGDAKMARGAPSFLSAGLPRDRRGRIGSRGGSESVAGAGSGAELDGRGRWRLGEDEESVTEGEWYPRAEEERSRYGYGYGYEVDTPRGAGSFVDIGRERDKELLESLRSPDPETTARMSMGGWGPDREYDDDVYEDDDGEDVDDGEEAYNEHMDWDSAQAVVERMVGIKDDSLPPTPSAREQQQQLLQQQQQQQLQLQQQLQQQSQQPLPPPPAPPPTQPLPPLPPMQQQQPLPQDARRRVI
ncbi:HbrB-like-domain-containing protein [Trametes gibbosa]|nr:HbrB-like-domain-containing protein [Trametes gibbosa]